MMHGACAFLRGQVITTTGTPGSSPSPAPTQYVNLPRTDDDDSASNAGAASAKAIVSITIVATLVTAAMLCVANFRRASGRVAAAYMDAGRAAAVFNGLCQQQTRGLLGGGRGRCLLHWFALSLALTSLTT